MAKKKTTARVTQKNAPSFLAQAKNMEHVQAQQAASKQPKEQSIFDKNIAALLLLDPLTAVQLQDVKPNEKFELFVTSDPANINLIDKESFKPVFVTNPVEETLKKIQELDSVQFYPHLYFFGAGN